MPDGCYDSPNAAAGAAWIESQACAEVLMKIECLPLAIFSAIIVGIAQTLLLLYCWAYIAAYTPLPRWLMSLGLHGMPLRSSLFFLDFLVSVVLCLPAAFALRQLRPRRLPICLIAAVIPGVIWQYRFFFQEPSAFREFVQFIPGIVSALLVLPVAVVVLSRAFKPATHA